jgi:predicted Zn-dependent protease
MIHRIIFATLLFFSVVPVYVPFSYAQDVKAVPCAGVGPGLDYFTVSDSNKNYLALVTSAHTDKILDFIREGKMQAAINDVVYTLDRFPNHPKGLQLASAVAKIANTPSLASCYFERAVKLYPQYAITHAQYGAYLIGSGQLDGGISRLKQAVEIDPKLAAAYALLAKAYNQTGKSDLAREAADKARELGYKGDASGQ